MWENCPPVHLVELCFKTWPLPLLYWCSILILACNLPTDDYWKVLWVIQRVEPQKHALNNSCIVLEFDKAGFNFFDVLPKCQNTISFYALHFCFSLIPLTNFFPQNYLELISHQEFRVRLNFTRRNFYVEKMNRLHIEQLINLIHKTNLLKGFKFFFFFERMT